MTDTNFLTEMIGNYYDCIVNIVYKLQKYTDAVLIEVKNRNIDTDDELISFMICESENIIKNNLYVTSIKILDLYENKYKNLIDNLKLIDNRKFYSSHKISEYFQEKIKHIDWDLIHYQAYTTDDENDRMKVYNFQHTFDKYLSKYKLEISNNEVEEISKDELIKNLEDCFDVFSKSLSDLLGIMKKSLTSYNSAIIMNDLIRFMIVTYICLSKIHII